MVDKLLNHLVDVDNDFPQKYTTQYHITSCLKHGASIYFTFANIIHQNG